MLQLNITEDGRPQLLVGGQPWLANLGFRISSEGSWIEDGKGELHGGSWEKSGDTAATEISRTYWSGDTALLTMTIRCEPTWASVRCKLVHDLGEEEEVRDAFDSPALLAPCWRISPGLNFFLTTFGHGETGEDYPGGHWPTALTGKAPQELPPRGFSPLVLMGPDSALAISAADYHLTSPLVRLEGGAGRTVGTPPGGFRAGRTWETWITLGDDLYSALRGLGDRLLSRSGKHRGQTQAHLVNTSLGWWNAYGGYYTELFRRLDATRLDEVEKSLRDLGLPIGYLGLDLWYPYQRIGQGTSFTPDRRKYPTGLRNRRRVLDAPYILHLSSLAPENEYGEEPASPNYYEQVAQELRRQGGVAAWHDWLRTQQHMTPTLRTDPEAAEHWFSGMAEHLAEEGIAVVLSMQTMGMSLASTQHPNIVAGRSHADYLSCQREALELATAQGHSDLLEQWISPSVLRRQNTLVGMVLEALGLAPFYDLFLSSPHPGLGGGMPSEEVLLRVLSCGPLGIGDGPGMSDRVLLQRALLDNGTPVRADGPLLPDPATLDRDVLLLWTKRSTPAGAWWYAVALNTASEPLSFRIDPPQEGETVIWDLLGQKRTEQAHAVIPAQGLTAFLFAPVRQGIAPLGLPDKLLPTPRQAWNARWEEGWRLEIKGTGRGALWAPQGAKVERDNGSCPPQERRGDYVYFDAAGEDGELRVRSTSRPGPPLGGGGTK
ncbi:MAG: hypothetical protein R6U88_05990 [Candidatus Bipolaricaulota bacterium]